MKSKLQCQIEAEFRKKEIARKTKALGATRCGNVKTSFGRCSREYLEGMGFFHKGSDRKPSKTAWVEKKLKKDRIEIEVRKKV